MAFDIVSFILGIIATIIGGVLTNLVYERLRNRITIRRITNPGDKDFSSFLDINEKLFDENITSTAENFTNWLKELPKDRYYILVVKVGDRVVGIMNFDFLLKGKYIGVNLIGVDKDALTEGDSHRRFLSETLLRQFQKIVSRELKDALGIIFEIETPRPSLSTQENRRLIARRNLFREYARKNGLPLYELPIDYMFPKLSLDEDQNYKEDVMKLMYIPLKKKFEHEEIYKSDLLDILKAAYLEWYGDSYVSEIEKDIEYKKYLAGILDSYKKSLPDRLALRKL